MSKKDEALKLALEALDIVKIHFTQNRHVNEAITTLRKALAEQPAQQEPVAWMQSDEVHISLWKDDYHTIPLYTSPQPSKPWVGLTHEDTYEATGTASTDLLDLAKLWSDNKVHVYQFDNEARKIIEAVLRRASAKLREKNA